MRIRAYLKNNSEGIDIKNIKSWFTNLSRVGKISVITALAVGGLFTVSAISQLSPHAPGSESTEKMNNIKKDPIVTTKEETKTVSIPYKKETIKSADLPKGETRVQTLGVDGVKTITYIITLVDGKETKRASTESVTSKPINEVTVVGAYVKPVPNSNCDPNYSGCVPIAYDVDCGGGGGNGPEYVYGVVQVIGTDIYGLDRDGDGWGCE